MEVEDMLARVSKQKKKAPTISQQRMQRMARVGALLKMGTEALADDESESEALPRNPRQTSAVEGGAKSVHGSRHSLHQVSVLGTHKL